MAYLLESDSNSGVNLTSRFNFAAFTSTQSDLVWCNVILNGLNAAAANITIDYDIVLGAVTHHGPSITRPKKAAADTGFHMLLGPIPLNSTGVLNIYGLSSNSSDSSITAGCQFYDYVMRDDVNEDVYHSDVKLTRDTNAAQDEWTVVWFKNGVAVTSGITSPTIQVVKRADGTDLVSSTTMTQIGSTGAYKYDEATNRVTTGESAVAIAGGTIDGAARTWRRVITRDA